MFFRRYHTLNTITINQNRLLNNYHYFQSLNSHALIAPVLKSNAYGHGLAQVARVIDQSIKPPFLCVDSLYEAYELQKLKIKTPVLIMGYTFPQNFKTISKLPFSFPVYDLDTLNALNKYQPHAKIHLKIDTGMNRLGLQLKQIPGFINAVKRLKRINLEGIYSHLSQADTNRNFTTKQVKLFKEAINLFRAAGINFTYRHLAATAGAIYLDDPDFNLARVGLGFYGYSPFPPSLKLHQQILKHLKPALKLTSHLVQVKTIKKGSQISYSGIYTAKKGLPIGILPIGYYDGIDRRLSNQGILTSRGGECPILGRVCMNLTIISLENINRPQIGDKITVISPNPKAPNSLANLSTLCDTIPYDLLVNLSETTKRIVI